MRECYSDAEAPVIVSAPREAARRESLNGNFLRFRTTALKGDDRNPGLARTFLIIYPSQRPPRPGLCDAAGLR
jgi:hypothetical protein